MVLLFITSDYVTIFLEILNPERHPSRITDSRVMAILLNAWMLPIHGASAVEGNLCSNKNLGGP